MEAALERDREERDRIAALLTHINEGRSLEDVLEYLFEAIQDVFPADRVAYAAIEDDIVRSVWARSRSDRMRLGIGMEAPLADHSLEKLAREGGIRIIADLEAHLVEMPDSAPTRLLVEEGMRSSLSVPLRAFGKPVGFLFLDSFEKGAYTADHARLMELIGGQLSLILEKSRLMMELEQANRILAREAVTDPLTGLANRRAFQRLLDVELRRSQRSGEPVALLLLDVDHFKAFNDRHGHVEGDACLVRIARILHEAAGRAGDFAARWGGEEFVVVLVGTPAGEAVEMAQRILTRIESEAIPHGASPVAPHVTASIGVAVAEGGVATELAVLLRAADEAVYRAKRGGRNRIELARGAGGSSGR